MSPVDFEFRGFRYDFSSCARYISRRARFRKRKRRHKRLSQRLDQNFCKLNVEGLSFESAIYTGKTLKIKQEHGLASAKSLYFRNTTKVSSVAAPPRFQDEILCAEKHTISLSSSFTDLCGSAKFRAAMRAQQSKKRAARWVEWTFRPISMIISQHKKKKKIYKTSRTIYFFCLLQNAVENGGRMVSRFVSLANS